MCRIGDGDREDGCYLAAVGLGSSIVFDAGCARGREPRASPAGDRLAAIREAGKAAKPRLSRLDIGLPLVERRAFKPAHPATV